MSQAPPYYGPPPQPAKSNTTLIVAIIVIVVVVVAIVGGIAAFSFVNFAASNLSQPHSLNIVNGLITVQAGGYNDYPFTLGPRTGGISISGSFTASGGSGNDIEVYVMDHTNFVNWQNGHQASAFYTSGQLTTGQIAAGLPGPGSYDLVYSNTFSTFSSKNVQTTVNLYYSG